MIDILVIYVCLTIFNIFNVFSIFDFFTISCYIDQNFIRSNIAIQTDLNYFATTINAYMNG